MNIPDQQSAAAAEHLMLSIAQKRIMLAYMLSSAYKPTRYVKIKNELVEVQDKLTTRDVLRIIALDNRLAVQMAKEQSKQNPKPQPAKAKKETVATTAEEQHPDAVEPVNTQPPAARPQPHAPKLNRKERRRLEKAHAASAQATQRQNNSPKAAAA